MKDQQFSDSYNDHIKKGKTLKDAIRIPKNDKIISTLKKSNKRASWLNPIKINENETPPAPQISSSGNPTPATHDTLGTADFPQINKVNKTKKTKSVFGKYALNFDDFSENIEK